MTYNLDFLIASLIFLLLILYHFINRRKLEDSTNRLFRLFILLGITDIAFDIITTMLIASPNPELSEITALILTIFYILQVLVPYALVLYAHSLCRTFSGQDSRISIVLLSIVLLSIPAMVMAVMVLLNFWSGFFFTIDVNGDYIRGPLYLVMYGYAGFYGIIVFIYSLFHYRKLGSKNFGIICEFLTIMVVCVTVQGIWNETLTTGLGLGLGITVFYLTINNPSDYIDWLTEDFNIQSLIGCLREYFRHKKKFHVIALNILDLKQVNMLFGLRFGDQFLCEISKKLHEILQTPYVFRVSSKRFLLLTCSLGEYARVRDEIQKLFDSSISVNGEVIRLHADICGIIDAQTLGNSDNLLAYMDHLISLSPSSADTLLIQNDENTMKNFRYNQEIKRFLRTAIADDLFEVHYQPVYSLGKKDYVTMEALSRLKHPDFGPVPPDVFITIAERSGQIAQIGLLQFRRVCTFVKEHPELLTRIDHINFNLSPAELLREGYSRQIIDTIREFSLPFSFFQLEITETVATEYSDILYRLADELNEYGIRLSLDDFGSGYANLNTVLRLPFSCIKLDRSLLNGISEDKRTELFYQNIVAALISMGYDVISEGVEDKKEIGLLKELGVDMIQGYYYSKPLPPEELLRLLYDSEEA